MAPGVGWGHNVGIFFAIVYIGKLLKKNLLKNHWARKAEIYNEKFMI
jgi:hypothetical protein